MANQKYFMDAEKVTQYAPYFALLRLAGCYEWYQNAQSIWKIVLNNVSFAMTMFILLNSLMSMAVNIYLDWTDLMSSLLLIADTWPVMTTMLVVVYLNLYMSDLYELIEYLDEKFVFHSAIGLTNMSMMGAYTFAKRFAFAYTVCTVFSVSLYAVLPMAVHYVHRNRASMAKEKLTKDVDSVQNFTPYFVLPMKVVGCYEWFPKAENAFPVVLNNLYLCFVLFTLLYHIITLLVNQYVDEVDIITSLSMLAETTPFIASFAIVAHFNINKSYLYEVIEYLDANFMFHSARGLTVMSMSKAYAAARYFAYAYQTCVMVSATFYAVTPMTIHWWTGTPLQGWVYAEVEGTPFVLFAFLRQLAAQWCMAFSVGQLGIFFAANSILLCGQMDLLCCSVRNARYTALLRHGVAHSSLVTSHGDIVLDEQFNYLYNTSEMRESQYDYDDKRPANFTERKTFFDIYSEEYDEATEKALQECAVICQVVAKYREMFENFHSPMLAVRVIQVTLYLCTLLYATSSKFEIVVLEYVFAVVLDIFVYCYYGNQIIIQADRVTTAAYQGMWHTGGVRSRRILLNILLANKRALGVRAGRFIQMDLRTYINIIKTSFSYYTLLVNVNNK